MVNAVGFYEYLLDKLYSPVQNKTASQTLERSGF